MRSGAPLVFGLMLWEFESPATGATVTSIWMESDEIRFCALIDQLLSEVGIVHPYGSFDTCHVFLLSKEERNMPSYGVMAFKLFKGFMGLESQQGRVKLWEVSGKIEPSYQQKERAQVQFGVMLRRNVG